MRFLRTPATIVAALGFVLVGAMARPLLVYPRRVKSLTASDGTRVTVEITHEVNCFECLTLGVAARWYKGYGLSVRLARPDGTTRVVDALSDDLGSESEARPEVVEMREGDRLVLSAPGGSATVDVPTGKLTEEE